MRPERTARAWPAVGVGLLLPLAFGCPVRFDDTVPASAPGLDGLVDITPVPPGAACPRGGAQVSTGTDVDRDGALGEDERTGASTLVCAGEDGEAGRALLLRVAPVAPDSECPHGGQEVSRGRDADGDGDLSDTEVESRQRLCHGAPGADGARGLVEVREASPEVCPEGGLLIATGMDLDGDGALSTAETASSASLCHAAPGSSGPAGEDGLDALAEARVVLPGSVCPTGGQELRAGYDLNRDGALDDEEVSFSAVACHGRGIGDGGGGELSGGTSEGTPAAPVALSVGGFFPDANAHEGSVAAGGGSHYRFSAPADPDGDDEVPYTLAFHGVEAPLDVELYASDDFSGAALPLACAWESATSFACATPPLVESQAHTLRVSEPRNLPRRYTLTLSFGARTGTQAAPAAAGPAASVHGGGRSVFSLPGAAGALRTVRLTNIRGPSGQAPSLVWELLPDGVTATTLGTCRRVAAGDVACATGALEGAERIAVRDEAGVGALFDVVLEEGDTLSVDGSLATFEPIPALVGERPWRRYPAPVAGTYTLAWRYAGAAGDYGGQTAVTVHPDHLSLQAGERVLAACGSDCVIEVPSELAGGSLYVALPERLQGSGGDHVLALFPLGGDEGAAGAPVALSLGDNLERTVEVASYYRVPAPTSPGRAAVRVSSAFDVDLRCQWYQDAAFQSPADYGAQANVIANGCVSPRRQPGQELFVTLYPNRLFNAPLRPTVFDLEIVEGDTVTPLLPLDAPPQLIEGGATWVYRLPPLAPGPYLFKTTTTGSVRRRLFGDHPQHVPVDALLTRCESSAAASARSSESPCDRYFVVPTAEARDHYAEVFANLQDVTVAVESVPVDEHAFGASEVYALSARGSAWFSFATTTTMDVRISAHQDVAGNQRIEVYSESYDELTFTSTFSYSSGPTTRNYSVRDLPAGTWNVQLAVNMPSAPQMTVTVVESP